MVYRNDDSSALRSRDEELWLGDDDKTGCPECGLINPEFYYVDVDGNIVGCEDCLRKVYAYE